MTNALNLRVQHAVPQGVNLCFYLLGKAQIRLPGLAHAALWLSPQGDPFADFARRFEVAAAGEIEPLHLEPLWRPWLEAVAQTCPQSAADALSAMPELPARPAVRTAFQRFGRVHLNDFLERWNGIRLDLEGRLAQALRTFDLGRLLARHQDVAGVEYRPARVTFHHHLLRVLTVSRGGAWFVLGAGHLERPGALANVVARQTLHLLIGQTEALEREDVRALLQGVRPLLADTYLRPADAVEQAMCTLLGVLEHEGEGAPLERIEARLAHPGLRLVARALYEQRRSRHAQGLAHWLTAALQQLGRARRT